MPLGIGLVEYGPLQGTLARFKQIRIPAADGGPVTLSSLTGQPCWVLALILAAATLAWTVARRGRRAAPVPAPAKGLPLRRPWKPWQAGVAIGLLALPAYLSSAASGRNYPLGVTHGVLQASLLLTDAPLQHVTGLPPARRSEGEPAGPEAPAPRKKVVWWLVLLVGSLMVGSNVSGRLSGETRLLPKPPEQILVAAAGGVLVGAGAALATGCVIGNILSGLALMSVGMLVFAVVTVLANWATTVLYLRGVS
jgi:hypothetical protein